MEATNNRNFWLGLLLSRGPVSTSGSGNSGGSRCWLSRSPLLWWCCSACGGCCSALASQGGLRRDLWWCLDTIFRWWNSILFLSSRIWTWLSRSKCGRCILSMNWILLLLYLWIAFSWTLKHILMLWIRIGACPLLKENLADVLVLLIGLTRIHCVSHNLLLFSMLIWHRSESSLILICYNRILQSDLTVYMLCVM